MDMVSFYCFDMIACIKGRKRRPRDGWDIYAWNTQKSVLTKRKKTVPDPHSSPSDAMKQDKHIVMNNISQARINVDEAKNHICVLSQS